MKFNAIEMNGTMIKIIFVLFIVLAEYRMVLVEHK